MSISSHKPLALQPNALQAVRLGLQRLLSGALPLMLFGCSTVPMTPGTVQAQNVDAPATGQRATQASAQPGQSSMDSQLMFELMISELAGRRGQLDVAMAGYLRAAERTDDPRVSERATRLAMFGRQWAAAEQVAKRWLQLDPDAPEAEQILAQALIRQDKLDDGAAVYIDLIERADSKDQAFRQVRAELASLDDPAQALEVMDKVLQAHKTLPQAHLTMARVQLSTNDRQAALQSVDDALQREPGRTDAVMLRAEILIALGRPDEGFQALDELIAANPERLSLRLAYAQMQVQAGRYDGVEEQLDLLYENAPDNADTLLTISILALDARRMDRARNYLTQLQSTGKYPDQANFYLARISDQQQDYKAAIDYYDAVQPGDLQLNAQIRIAELLGITGELEEGRARLRRMAATVPDPEIQPQLLTAESRMLQQAGQAPEAVKVLTEGLDRFPGNTDLMYSRALAADAAGDSAMMVADLTDIIEAEPENAHALNALGYYLADNNKELGRAEQLLVKSNELLPNDPAIMDSLGWLRYRQGKLSEAIELLRAAYVLYPDTEIAAHLGEALWINGEEEAARKLIEEALLESPEDDLLLQVKQKYIE